MEVIEAGTAEVPVLPAVPHLQPSELTRSPS